MRSRRRRWRAPALILTLLPLVAACDAERDREVRLAGHTLSGGFDPDLIAALQDPAHPRVHTVLHFSGPLTPDQRRALRDAEVTLLGYLGDDSYFAAIPPGAVLGSGPLATLADADLLTPDEKIDPRLHDPPWWVRRGSDRVAVVVEFFDDVRPDDVALLPASVAVDPARIGQGAVSVEILLSEVPAIARIDAVKRIHARRVPSLPLTEVQRADTRSDDAQMANLTALRPTFRVDGSPIHVAICDEGINTKHNDFKDVAANGSPGFLRVSPTGSSSSEHGTHVASIVASSGYGSALEGLNPFERRGHAPYALLGDFTTFGADLAKTHEALVLRGMQLMNHSYVQSPIVYDWEAAQLDRIVRGDATYSGVPIPARPQVWAAGNNGTAAQYPSVSLAAGYYSGFTSAKNTISVGSVSAPLNNLSAFTSLGPTLDGRIKPDLVAPGCHGPAGILAASDGYVGGYSGDCGTSFAAPAVTGILALVMQQLEQGGANLAVVLPSTYKALLIEAARDLSEPAQGQAAGKSKNPDTGQPVSFYPGPDFATGWGLVDAEATRQLAEHPDQWREDQIEVQGASVEYCIEVPEDSGELKVTLAWDDLPGQTGSPETSARLVNDLDLTLVEPGPTGKTVLPWTLAPPSITDTPSKGIVESFGAADIVPAARGVDHLNNVEMVQESDPVAGTWKVVVTGYRLPMGTAQTYSLATSHPLATECP